MNTNPSGARELYDAGRLSDALKQLKQEVKNHPEDPGKRSFLFCLFCFEGDYARAGQQLDILALQSASAEVGARAYHNVLSAERRRQEALSGNRYPEFLLEPPAYTYSYIEALKAFAAGKIEKAAALLREFASRRPLPIVGKIDGIAFEDFSEYNDLVAPFLEIFIYDRYVWAPFEQLKRIQIEAPGKIQDLLWIPARVELQDGQFSGGFIPTRYVDSEKHSNELVKLGRMTEWESLNDDELLWAAGQRMFRAGETEKALLEVREITFQVEGKN